MTNETSKTFAITKNMRIPSEIQKEIFDYMQEITPSERITINNAAMTSKNTPHDDDITAFVAYAIRNTLKKVLSDKNLL